MGLIEKVRHEEKESISVRMEVGLLARLNRYAEYLGGTREYVISEAVKAALKLADSKDEDWKAFDKKPQPVAKPRSGKPKVEAPEGSVA